jgi:hypothetical protein
MFYREGSLVENFLAFATVDAPSVAPQAVTQVALRVVLAVELAGIFNHFGWVDRNPAIFTNT